MTEIQKAFTRMIGSFVLNIALVFAIMHGVAIAIKWLSEQPRIQVVKVAVPVIDEDGNIIDYVY